MQSSSYYVSCCNENLYTSLVGVKHFALAALNIAYMWHKIVLCLPEICLIETLPPLIILYVYFNYKAEKLFRILYHVLVAWTEVFMSLFSIHCSLSTHRLGVGHELIGEKCFCA